MSRIPDPTTFLTHSVPPLPAACRHYWQVTAQPCGDAYPACCRRYGARRAFPVLDTPYDPFDFGSLADGSAWPSPLPAEEPPPDDT